MHVDPPTSIVQALTVFALLVNIILELCQLKVLTEIIKQINHTNVQFSPVTQSYPTLRDPMDRGTPGLPVYHQLPEFTHTHAH